MTEASHVAAGHHGAPAPGAQAVGGAEDCDGAASTRSPNEMTSGVMPRFSKEPWITLTGLPGDPHLPDRPGGAPCSGPLFESLMSACLIRQTPSMPSINQRASTAAAATSAHVLRDLAVDTAPKVRAAVARNPAAPTAVLERLAADPSWRVRFAVAENPSAVAGLIALRSPDSDTRGVAAQRSDLGAEGVQLALADTVPSVRAHLATSTQDAQVAAVLAADPHPAVRAAIVLNPVLSDADVETLASDPIARVRATAAASRRVRPATLTRLAGDRSAEVRWSVLVHNPERLDLARMIATDRDETNSSQARSQLERPREFTRVLGDIDLVM